MKKVILLLVTGFVVISAIVAFVPSLVNIGSGETTGMTAAAITVAEWLIPLGVAFLVLMLGITALSPKKRKTGGSRRLKRWIVNRRLADPRERQFRAARRAARGRGMARINDYSHPDSAWF